MSITITAADFENLPERAVDAINREGIHVFSERAGLSVSTLRRIVKTKSLGDMRGLTAVRLIAALKDPPTLEERVADLERRMDCIEGERH